MLFSFSCPYLHRVAGDVERRYHLRYYKTATCVHETDTRGYCVKNGPHCAFAHGPHDLRQPVYDIRELQAIEKEETEVGQAGIENNKAVLEDPRWQGLCSTVRCSNVHKWYPHLHFLGDLFTTVKDTVFVISRCYAF